MTVQAQPSGRTVAYVGAYTDRGKGIHLFTLDQADGTLVPWKVVEGLPNPSSLAFDPTKKYLYAVNEIANYNGTESGSVTRTFETSPVESRVASAPIRYCVPADRNRASSP